MFSRIITLIVAFSFWQCSSPTVPTYKELAIQFVNQLRPRLIGSWQFKQTQIDAKKLNWSSNYTGIQEDTVLQNLATLTLGPFSGKVYDERLLDLDGSIRFREKEYPVEVRIYPTHIDTGKQGIMMVFFKHNPQIDYNTANVRFMESIGLVGVNFRFVIGPESSTMMLQTEDKGIASANLIKDK